LAGVDLLVTFQSQVEMRSGSADDDRASQMRENFELGIAGMTS
jgi:hypothetical protein